MHKGNEIHSTMRTTAREKGNNQSCEMSYH